MTKDINKPTFTGRKIKCRAKASPNCKDGTDEWAGKEMDGDGTYDGHSIVCDPCYVYLMPLSPSGRLLANEIQPTIEAYNRAKAELSIEQEAREKNL